MEAPAIHIHPEKGPVVKYTDPIDLSNACRAFYQSRLEATRRLREKWKENKDVDEVDESSDKSDDLGLSNAASRYKGRKKNSLDSAIELLRREMASLMDQDLTLMKQLLTLNEEIEDLKWRRRHFWRSASSFCSSDMIQSAASLGRVDEHQTLQFSTPSSLSLQLEDETMRFSVYNDDDPTGTFNRINDTMPSYNKTASTVPPNVSKMDKSNGVISSNNFRKSLSMDKRLSIGYYQNNSNTYNTLGLTELGSNDNRRNAPNKSDINRVIVRQSQGKQPEHSSTILAGSSFPKESLQTESFRKNEDGPTLERTDTRSEFSLCRKVVKDLDVDTESHDSGIHDCNSVDI